MTKRILKSLFVVLVLAALTWAIGEWFQLIKGFVNINTNLIQGISNALQILIWIGALAWFALKWVRGKKQGEVPPSVGIDNSREIHARTYVENIEKQVIKDSSKLSKKELKIAYLNHLFNASRNLSLSGIDPKAASQASSYLHLESVYTALRTLTAEDHKRMLQGNELSGKGERHLSAVALLNKTAHLVLLGDPGSGKSTFVNFVGLCLAGEQLGKTEANLKLLRAPVPEDADDAAAQEKELPPQDWDHPPLLPVRVILRDFAARGLPNDSEKATAKHIWEFIAGELESTTLGDYAPILQDTLMKKGGLLMLDGLDEVPEAEQSRVQIKQAVESFKAVYPKCRILITSRTYAYQKQDWRLPDFQEAILAPFTKSQIERFVDHWYAHIGEMRGWNEDDHRGKAVSLKSAIAGSTNLSELAGRPLLLTLMASLHAWRGGTLPDKREQLYSDTVELLLDWWEMHRTVKDAAGNTLVQQPSLVEWLKVDRHKVRQLLNRLAFEAHAGQPELQGTADISEGDLVTGLIGIANTKDIPPQRLIEFLSDRAGLLIQRGAGIYTFPHRTFQEYLAACHLTDDEFPDKLAGLASADPNRWREVLLLAGAKAARGAASNIWLLANALCYHDCKPEQATTKNLWGAHLAGQALAETADLTQLSERHEIQRKKVRHWLEAIKGKRDFPAVERAAAGVSLAVLGDTRPEVQSNDSMQFCLVPGGPFSMGTPKEQILFEKYEGLLHENGSLNAAYFISRYPVSNAQFAEFVREGGYTIEAYWSEAREAGYWLDGKVQYWKDKNYYAEPIDFGMPYHLPNHPVVGVTWYEALAYTRWLTERWREEGWLNDHISVVLPSEAEWEKAVRGGNAVPREPLIIPAQQLRDISKMEMMDNPDPQRNYSWGNDPDPNAGNYAETQIGASSALGCFPHGASPYGCAELTGNVWEWTRSLWGEDSDKAEFGYPYDNPAQREDIAAPGKVARVVRGGSFGDNHYVVRCSFRYGLAPVSRFISLGFRVVVSP